MRGCHWRRQLSASLIAILSWPVLDRDPSESNSRINFWKKISARATRLIRTHAVPAAPTQRSSISRKQRGHESEETLRPRNYYEFRSTSRKSRNRVAIRRRQRHDVAAALRMGPPTSIDRDRPGNRLPRQELHPDIPMTDPRVTLNVNDARNFFRTAISNMNLIIYGVLDSHTSFKPRSKPAGRFLRLHGEGIAEAFKLLSLMA